MTATPHDRAPSPSEDTPLIRRASEELQESNVPMTFARGFVITVTMGLFLFIQGTNVSMMTTAQSAISEDLDAFSATTWFNSAYLIGMSSVTPLAGRLCQIFTPRVYVLFSAIILSIGLFVTAAASRLAVFLLGRALSGCAGGGLLITAIILSLDLPSKRRRGVFIGLINVGATTGIASGAVLAGIFTPLYGWRFIFWIQAPLSLILGPILYLSLPPPDRDEGLFSHSLVAKLAKVDYAGALTLALSVFLLLLGLSSTDITITPIILCPVVFAIFLLIESKYATDPIIPIKILKLRSVVLTCLAGLISMMSRWATLFFTPVYASAVRTWPSSTAGLILVPTNAGFGLGGVLVGWLHIRSTSSYYISNLVVYLLFALSSLTLSLLSTPASPTTAYLATTFLNGLFAGALMNYSLSHVLHLTDPQSHYIVSSLLGMSRSFAGSFGSAIGGGFFQRQLKKSLEDGFARYGLPGREALLRKLLGSPALVGSLTGLERTVAIEGYESAVRSLLLGGCVLTLVAGVAHAGTGWRPYSSENGKRGDDDENSSDMG
ncbi:putative transporter [Aspergillus taichungensis]|uniref:Putative transporter n=1 Tax=Aspergillus taichungensis TaxID=482145 RepID=A0A2J5I4Q7_9EURO|nr:putative transporter [Aspergillus taichungensis]